MSHRPKAQKVVAPIMRIWKAFWNEAPRHLFGALKIWFITVENWLLDSKKTTYGLAVTRVLFSVTALGLLASNFTTRLYTFGSGSAWTSEISSPKSEFPNIWLFSLFHRVVENDFVFTLLYLLVAALAVTVLIGYRTRLLLPVFWVLWVSLIELQDMVSDQGDNIFRIALFGMLFADTSGRWSMDAARRKRSNPTKSVLTRLWQGNPVFPQPLVNMAHNLVVVTLTCQVVFIYVSGALYKAGGKPWQDGTAVYAPLHVTRFAPWPELSEIVTAWAPAVAAMSIGSVLIQLFFPGALLFRWTRIPILFGMIGFHAGIGVFMGLPWFSLAMVSIDSIFVRDVTWQRMETWFKNAAREQPQPLPDDVAGIASPAATPNEMQESSKSASSNLLDAGRR